MGDVVEFRRPKRPAPRLPPGGAPSWEPGEGPRRRAIKHLDMAYTELELASLLAQSATEQRRLEQAMDRISAVVGEITAIIEGEPF